MKNRKLRIIATTILSITMLFTISASATTYSSWKTTGTINGYKYKYRAGLLDVSGGIQGRAHADVVKGTVPAKYIGGRSYIYNKKGALIASSDWAYNKKSCAGIDFAGKTVSSSGSYYCIAKFKFKKKDGGYSGVYTSKSTKYVALKSGKAVSNESSIIDNDEIRKVIDTIDKDYEGKTYGSGLNEFIDQASPDMILAVGENGETGYVSTNDLSLNNVKGQVDGVVLARGESFSRYIPVYSKSGQIIDKFLLFTECVE